MFLQDEKDEVISLSLQNRWHNLLKTTEPQCRKVLCKSCSRNTGSDCVCAQLSIFIDNYTDALLELNSNFN